MAFEYSDETVRRLTDLFNHAGLHRPMRIERYDPGTELIYEVTGVLGARAAQVRLAVERFVGGGFAGQVYRVKVAEIDSPAGPIEGLEVGGSYAVKILLPPTTFARRFRNLIYKVGFQAPFSLGCNPAAARAGALWQKLIRRAAAVRFADERAVVDVLATFVDPVMGSCGEISEWVEGRTWRYEVEDRLLARWRWKTSQPYEHASSPEYRAKKTFMAEFVELLGRMGAPELARQYQWWTCKSQPNALKRLDTEDDPEKGLTAVDFRAGLALLPCLPMSPGDFKLIFKGLARGSLVQFDRGDPAKLRRFVARNGEDFAGLRGVLDELTTAEEQYRASQIDLTHNHVRLLYSRKLWSRIFDATVTGWKVRNITDERTDRSLRSSRVLTMLFFLVGAIPGLGLVAGVALLVSGLAAGRGVLPAIFAAAGIAAGTWIVGGLLTRLWGRGDYRRHAWAILTRGGYLGRAVRGHVAETLIRWNRAGRVSDSGADKIADQIWRYFAHLPLSVLPVFLHRLLTDRRYALDLLHRIAVRPVRLYFNAHLREQWLREMVADGRRRHMLTDEDAGRIISRIDEPFIQKYLQSLAVHVCTLPVTQIVSVIIAAVHVAGNWGTSPFWTLWWEGWAIIAFFQITPISPGSLVRGFYVLYLVIRERNFKDYNIAVFLGFFKYVGYLAFPIQMAQRYPALARFMAAHWATGAVRAVPVFGEHGALLEHGVFDLFYNYPLTVRRRMRERARLRAGLPSRSWHALPIVLASVSLLALVDVACRNVWGALPTLRDIWLLAILLPTVLGAAVTLGCGGARLGRRVMLAAVSAVVTAAGYSIVHAALLPAPALAKFAVTAGWGMFLFTLLATVSAMLTEINLPEPRDEKRVGKKSK